MKWLLKKIYFYSVDILPFNFGYKEDYPWHEYIVSLRYGALANDLFFFFAESMFAFLGGKKPVDHSVLPTLLFGAP